MTDDRSRPPCPLPPVWPRRAVLRSGALGLGALAAGLVVPATARAAGSGRLRLPAPVHDVWDFDDRAVPAWDSDVSAASESALNAAIAAALAQGGGRGRGYHRITWTGGDIAGNLTLKVRAALPDRNGPQILIQGADPTVIDGELRIGPGVSNVKFRGFRLQPRSTNFSKGKGICIRPLAPGGGRRLAFEGCQFGAFWRRGAVHTYPEAFGGGGTTAGWEVTLKNNEGRGLFQFITVFAGWFHLEQNLVTGLVDDFAALTVRGRKNPAGLRVCYAYIAGNVILDMADQPKYSGLHPDFFQCGTPTDAAGDQYHVQRYGNVYIGDTYRQYPTQNSIVQRDKGGATRFEIDTRDNVILNTGTRGMWLPDRRISLHRDMMAWPPLAGLVPTRGPGWKGAPRRQNLRSFRGAFGRNSDIDVGTYIAADRFRDTAKWGVTGLDPVLIADPTAPPGRSTAFDQVFPNMTGLGFVSGQVRIPLYTGPRTKEAVRAFVSRTYMPRSPRRGAGWGANGFYDPAGWFA
ncbi:MAG: hypothetical protein ACWA5A_12570 [Marinibacterium sp.]